MIIAHNYFLENREKEFHGDDGAALMILTTLTILHIMNTLKHKTSRDIFTQTKDSVVALFHTNGKLVSNRSITMSASKHIVHISIFPKQFFIKTSYGAICSIAPYAACKRVV